MSAPIPFQGFDERREVRFYHNGILPHWRQDGCTYFVTFRQADALPEPVIREFKYEQNQWLQHHGIDPTVSDWRAALRRLSHADRRTYERLMASRLNDFLDAGHGSCALRRVDVARVVFNSLYHFHGERVLTGDSVVMPNHVHVLMRPLPGFELEEILQAIKSFTANRVNKLLQQDGQFWMRESYDHIVRDYEQLEAFQRYIAANPQKAGLSSDACLHRRAIYSPDE
jgi:type I restriction enzyme R subunit